MANYLTLPISTQFALNFTSLLFYAKGNEAIDDTMTFGPHRVEGVEVTENRIIYSAECIEKALCDPDLVIPRADWIIKKEDDTVLYHGYTAHEVRQLIETKSNTQEANILTENELMAIGSFIESRNLHNEYKKESTADIQMVLDRVKEASMQTGIGLSDAEVRTLNAFVTTIHGEDFQSGTLHALNIFLTGWSSWLGKVFFGDPIPYIKRIDADYIEVSHIENIINVFNESEGEKSVLPEDQPLVIYADRFLIKTNPDQSGEITIGDSHTLIEENFWRTQILPVAHQMLDRQAKWTPIDLAVYIPCLCDPQFVAHFWQRIFSENTATLALAEQYIRDCFKARPDDLQQIFQIKNIIENQQRITYTRLASTTNLLILFAGNQEKLNSLRQRPAPISIPKMEENFLQRNKWLLAGILFTTALVITSIFTAGIAGIIGATIFKVAASSVLAISLGATSIACASALSILGFKKLVDFIAQKKLFAPKTPVLKPVRVTPRRKLPIKPPQQPQAVPPVVPQPVIAEANQEIVSPARRSPS